MGFGGGSGSARLGKRNFDAGFIKAVLSLRGVSLSRMLFVREDILECPQPVFQAEKLGSYWRRMTPSRIFVF